MGPLEKKLESFESADTIYNLNQDFRLILTTMSCDFFPISILQNAMKLTCEPPKGIKSNMLQTYSNLTDERLATPNPEKANILAKLFFSVSLFHAVCLERRKYGSIGFNEFYQFSESDLEAAHYSLKNLIEQFPYTPWLALNFIIGQINYGGRVTDEWDRRVTSSLLRKFCSIDVLKDDHTWTEDYKSISVGPLKKYRKYIESLPNVDETEIFGLHSNANINYQQ